jgi:hypothetical protein
VTNFDCVGWFQRGAAQGYGAIADAVGFVEPLALAGKTEKKTRRAKAAGLKSAPAV